MSLLIDLQNVSKNYVMGEKTFHALKNIQFQVNRSDMLAILGASGSGKSTLMNIIGFLDQATQGSYFFDGVDVSHLEEDALAQIRNKKIGFVFQSFFLLPRLTALQNVMLPLFYREEDAENAKQKSLLILEKVGMEKLAHHKPNQLSGGQQQRVAIARALVGNPEVILADEPTGALDSETGADVMNLFLQLNTEGCTIVIVTHDKEISRLCRKIVRLKDGEVVS